MVLWIFTWNLDPSQHNPYLFKNGLTPWKLLAHGFSMWPAGQIWQISPTDSSCLALVLYREMVSGVDPGIFIGEEEQTLLKRKRGCAWAPIHSNFPCFCKYTGYEQGVPLKCTFFVCIWPLKVYFRNKISKIWYIAGFKKKGKNRCI